MTGPAAFALLTGALLALSPPAAAAPVVVIARDPAEPVDLALQQVAAELGLRCPARQVPYEPLSPQLPRFVEVVVAPPLPEVLNDPAVEFFRSEDWLGSAVRFTKAAADLAREPVALLAQPERRLRLRDAYLYAARALLQAGRTEEARAQLAAAAARLPDLPPPSAARWGPALAAAAEAAGRALPPPAYPLLVEGPPGWAVHVDEQPLGALPRQRALLRAGPHAVVAVGPEGRRASWLLEPAGAPGAPLRLLVDPRLGEVCAGDRHVALCAAGALPAGAEALAQLLDTDVVVLRRRGDVILGWRQARGAGAPLAAAAAVATAGTLAPRLCTPASIGAAAPPISLRGPRDDGARRLARWPGALLLGAGAALALGAVPLFVQDGRCVDEDCARIYDFRGLPAGLLGAGAALTLGGAVWLIVALRR